MLLQEFVTRSIVRTQNKNAMSVFLTGLVEEYMELKLAIAQQQSDKNVSEELGDVLTYAALIFNVLTDDPTETMTNSLVVTDLYHENKETEVLVFALGKTKRFLRGDVTDEQLLAATVGVVDLALQLLNFHNSNVTLDMAIDNVTAKLDARVAKNAGSFKGTGSNR